MIIGASLDRYRFVACGAVRRAGETDKATKTAGKLSKRALPDRGLCYHWVKVPRGMVFSQMFPYEEPSLNPEITARHRRFVWGP